MAPSCAAYDVTGLADRNQADDTFRFLPCVKIVVTVRQTRKQKAPTASAKSPWRHCLSESSSDSACPSSVNALHLNRGPNASFVTWASVHSATARSFRTHRQRRA